MRTSSGLVAAIALLFTCCTGNGTTGKGEDAGTKEPLSLDSLAPMLHRNLTSIAGSGLRFDGFYYSGKHRRHQLMRFYPQGFVVMANGMDSTERFSELSRYLEPTAASKPYVGIHNVPVIIAGDSLYMVTPSDRGNIDYRGRIITPDSLSIHKYSHIQGGSAIVGYDFLPDE